MSDVPQGTVDDVLGWVGDDPDRAQQALEAEREGQQRSTLMTKLEAISCREDSDVTDTADPQYSADDTTTGESSQSGEATATNQPSAVAYEEHEDWSDSEEVRQIEPEQPREIQLDPRDSGTVVGAVHARDTDVEVPDDAAIEPIGSRVTGDPYGPGGRFDPERDEDDEPDPIEGEQVEYFQVIGGSNGAVISINGTAFALSRQTSAAFKQAFDKAVVGMAL